MDVSLPHGFDKKSSEPTTKEEVQELTATINKAIEVGQEILTILKTTPTNIVASLPVASLTKE